jgi:predicted nucleic acid-binding Zn ribbon protein
MKRKKPDRKVKPEPLSVALSQFLSDKGLNQRVVQSRTIDDWADVVGTQIARVTEAISIRPDGTLLIAVTTNAWMTELSLMEPELIRLLNVHASAWRVKKIRFQLKR